MTQGFSRQKAITRGLKEKRPAGGLEKRKEEKKV